MKFVLLSCALAAPSPVRAGAGLPDLAVEGLGPEALCVGKANRVTVTVANRGSAPSPEGSRLVLTVQLPGHPPAVLRGEVGALDAGESSTVAFDGVVVEQPAEVLLRAEVDPDGSVAEVSRGNNAGSVLVPATASCGSVRTHRRPVESARPAALLLV